MTRMTMTRMTGSTVIATTEFCYLQNLRNLKTGRQNNRGLFFKKKGPDSHTPYFYRPVRMGFYGIYEVRLFAPYCYPLLSARPQNMLIVKTTILSQRKTVPPAFAEETVFAF